MAVCIGLCRAVILGDRADVTTASGPLATTHCIRDNARLAAGFAGTDAIEAAVRIACFDRIGCALADCINSIICRAVAIVVVGRRAIALGWMYRTFAIAPGAGVAVLNAAATNSDFGRAATT